MIGRSTASREQQAVPSLLDKLTSLSLFEQLSECELDALAGELEWLCIPGGWELFHEGDPGDSLFVVVAGRMGVVTADADGRQSVINQIGAGETVGEMALVSGDARSATIVALRDTELLRLERSAFERLTEQHTGVMRFIMRLLVRRVYETSHRIVAQPGSLTIAVLPLERGSVVHDFTRGLAKALEAPGRRVLIADSRNADQSTEWFNAIEAEHDFVIYEADYELSEWTRRCVRQADRLVLLATAVAPADSAARALEVMPAAVRGEQIEIVFLHPANASRELMARYGGEFHYHVREDNAADLARMARLLSGHAVGVVFSGGGARGFAHLGVMKAFRRSGIELDMFGGTSMGSMMAAAAALEWGEAEALEHFKQSFVQTNPLNDYTLPLLALVRGRKVSRLLREHFGDTLIEECFRPFFCTSSNLTLGQTKLHRTGPIWRALRASVAIPGVLPPVVMNNEILIDGGVMNNLPVDIMSAMRRGRVVGIDVARDHVLSAEIADFDERPLWQLALAQRSGAPTIISLLMSAGTINGEAQFKMRRQHVDLLIELNLGQMGMLEWKSWESAVEGGYRQTMEILERSGADWRATKPALNGETPESRALNPANR
jgi:NTE family protein